jgi:signal transduction histidine kinase
VRAVVVDVGLGVGVAFAVAAAIAADLGWGAPGARAPDVVAYSLALSLGVFMLVRRRWPVPVLLATLTVLLAYYALQYPPVGIAVPTAAAFYTVAESGRLRWAIATAAAWILFTTSYRYLEGDDVAVLFGYELVIAVLPLAAVIALGDAVRSRRGWRAEIERRARLAEIEREQEAARRVEEERVRIARELHDVLAHTVSVISIQADVASEALPDDPRDAQAALGVIRRASREALGELRGTLGLLRGPAASQPRRPVAGLAHLDRIVASAADSGLAVAVRVEGPPAPLPVVVDAAAHRIVQESITNVLRHAGAGTATVELRYEPGALTVRVLDDGRGGAVDGTGYGIRGMRERVALLGGDLRAGPRPEGGFAVEATLPLGGQP